MLPLAFALTALSFLDAVSACNPYNNCNDLGYCCCSNSALYSAEPVGRTCRKRFRGYMLAVILVPILVGLAICLGVSYCQRKRIARLRPGAYQTGAGPAPVPYVSGPGAYMGGPGAYVGGPGAYPSGPGSYPDAPYQGGPGAYQEGAYQGGPYQGGPSAYQGGPPAYGQPAYPVNAYPPAANLPGDPYKEAPAPYR